MPRYGHLKYSEAKYGIYPDYVRYFLHATNHVDDIVADDVNTGQAEIDSLAQAIGLDIPGDYATLAARLDGLEGKQFIGLQVPLTSTSWDGDAYSTTGITQIDMNAVFGVPLDAYAVLLRVTGRDSVAVPAGSPFFSFGSLSATYYDLSTYQYGGDFWAGVTGILTLDTGCTLWYRITASGAGTLDCWVEVWGYWMK